MHTNPTLQFTVLIVTITFSLLSSKSLLVNGYTISAEHEEILKSPEKTIQLILKGSDLTDVNKVSQLYFVVLLREHIIANTHSLFL